MAIPALVIRPNLSHEQTYEKPVEAVDIEQAKEGRADPPHGHRWLEVGGREVHDDALPHQQEDRLEANQGDQDRYSVQGQNVEPVLKRKTWSV